MSRVDFRNDSGETIPACGAMRVVDVIEHKGQSVLTVEKPDGSGDPCLLNGPVPIADGGYGQVQAGEIVAAYYDDAATPDLGDELGPEDGEWKLTTAGSGWVFLGALAGQKIGLFRVAGGSTPVIGKPATNFTEGTLTAPNNVVNLWRGPAHGGSSAATGRTVTADYSTGIFGTGDFVFVTTASDGKKYVTCFPTG